MSTTATHKRPHRQARGERRIQHVLDSAARTFAEVGYEAATTNAIAARAGMSPGSLYQFFPNKDAIVEALSERYVELLRVTQSTALAPEVAHLPIDALLDRVIDPLVAFEVDQPGFRALLNGADVSARCAAATLELHQAVHGQVEVLLAARVPDLPASQRTLCARVSVQLFKALLPLIVAAESAERAALIVELKAALRGYLAPVIGESGPRDDTDLTVQP